MNKKNILIVIVLLAVLLAALLILYRYKEKRNTERSFFVSNQIKMKRILTFSKEYNQKDPYLLYLELFKQPAKRRYDPFFFIDLQSAISNKSEDLYHYYTAIRLFSDSEVKEQPLSRDEFERMNDFLILCDAQNNIFIYSKISNTFYPKLNEKTGKFNDTSLK